MKKLKILPIKNWQKPLKTDKHCCPCVTRHHHDDSGHTEFSKLESSPGARFCAPAPRLCARHKYLHKRMKALLAADSWILSELKKLDTLF